LSSGTTYELGIAAIDLSANMSAKDSITKMTLGGLDNVSPTAPTNLYVTDITMTNATLWFTPSTDNYAVAGYVLYIDTDSIATLTDTATMYGLSKLIPNTEYDVALKAFDAAKNMSESGSITFKTSLPPDVTPPSTPTNFSAGSVIDNSVELTWDASTDDMGTITYNVYEGDNLLANVSTLSYTVSDLAENQEYVFYLEAMDNSKNKSEKASVTVTTVGIGNEAVAMVKIWCAYKNVFVNVESASNSEVKIYNVLGTIVYQNTLSEGLNTIQLNEKTGIYIVKTNVNNHVNVVRVVIK
jgi:chitodextrinase